MSTLGDRRVDKNFYLTCRDLHGILLRISLRGGPCNRGTLRHDPIYETCLGPLVEAQITRQEPGYNLFHLVDVKKIKRPT